MEAKPNNETPSSSQPAKQKRGNRNGTDKKKQQLVQLKTVERVFKWPLVETSWKCGTDVYGRIKGKPRPLPKLFSQYVIVVFSKGSNFIINWTFDLAENTCIKIISLSKPVVATFKRPIDFVDATVDKGLGQLEKRAPIVKEEPAAILEQTKECVKGVVQPTIDRATNIVIYSKGKANNVLSTTYGSKVVNEVDKLILGADKLIDRLMPKRGDEVEKTAVSIDDDPLLHVLEHVGFVVSKLTRRVLVTLHA